MQFTVNGIKLNTSVTLAAKLSADAKIVTETAEKLVHIIADKKRQLVYVACSNGASRYFHQSMPAEVVKSGQFSIHITRMQAICKARNDMTFTIKDDKLAFQLRKGQYKGEGISLVNQVFELQKPKLPDPLPSRVRGNLQAAFKECRINSVFNSELLAASIVMHDKHLLVIVADNYHAAIASFKLNKAERIACKRFRKPLILPLPYTHILTNFIDDELQISASEKQIMLADKSMLAVLPALQLTTIADFSVLLKSAKPMAVIEHSANLLAVCDNLKAIAKGKTPITLKLEEPWLSLIYKSGSGRMSDQIPAIDVQGQFKLRLEPVSLSDLLNKMNGPMAISHSKHAITFTKTMVKSNITVRYMSSLLQ